MKLKKSASEMVKEARARIEEIETTDLIDMVNDENVVIVDIRDIRERQRTGAIPGSVHAPRGMIEFWIDPDSPYCKEIFGSGKRFVFYCQSGWRSALATQTVQNMGLENVCHIGGGFRAWADAGNETEAVEKR